ncbi:MMPL family transporter [Nocardia yamanashiensis]|uniref:MMPL family transporter n=1 Tax=Nocardia yamanashiensis TaxID=209247 RepID=UPI001E428C61|nr:MMPL family transporter [Nocardia yamanashiensis]UGT40706.1 MMPL family transporter [Nocardia yamanashiensis]
MFTRWGDLVYKLRYTVLGVTVAALLSLGYFGLGVENHLSSSGWFDPNSESTQAAVLKDSVYTRDHNSDVVLLYTAPDGQTVDDPAWNQKIIDSLNSLPKNYPQITKVNVAPWKTETGQQVAQAVSPDRKSAFATVALNGNNDTEMLAAYGAVQNAFAIPGVKVEVGGLQPVAYTLNNTIASDVKRMELIALPAVAVLLFFIFGGIVAAALPLIIGGLTIIAANGMIMALTKYTEVNSFVSAVVSMIGLGLAIDYGLFIVSRFREELAEGYDTKAAVRRSVMTAGRTVSSSATMIIAASAGMLLFPQGFLKSVAYGTIAAVLLAMITSLTVLPALLAILGPRVDSLSLKWIRKTKTAEEVEAGFWGKLTAWVMKHPLKVAIPLTIGLLLLIIPVKNLQFGGISETYLPPDNPVRLAQQHFDETFPLRKSDPVQLVIITDNSRDIGPILTEANQAPGLVKNAQFGIPAKPPNGSNVWVSDATVEDSAHPEATIDYLRSMEVPDGAEVLVTGQPAMQMDSLDTLLDRMPWMIGIVLLVTTILMFLTFGSLVLPFKAALMSALGLGSTLGILTWIFIDGHGASLLNFTPQPITAPVLVLIIAIIYGLSVDYEVFLLSRMVEARTQGASTTEAVRAGTAQTGRIITAAALILLVVTGAFAFSDLVMMQYIAYGMVAALFIDATVLRMLLVPATMKLLGDDCWWAPAWMKKIQQKIGLGEPILDDERPGNEEVVDLVKTTPVTDPVTMQIPMLADGSTPARPARKPRPVRTVDSEAPTQRIADAAPTIPVISSTTPAPTPPKPENVSAPADPDRKSGFGSPAGDSANPGLGPTSAGPAGFGSTGGAKGFGSATGDASGFGPASSSATGFGSAPSGTSDLGPASSGAGGFGTDAGGVSGFGPAAGGSGGRDRATDGAFTPSGLGTPGGSVRPAEGGADAATTRGGDGAFAPETEQPTPPGGPVTPSGGPVSLLGTPPANNKPSIRPNSGAAGRPSPLPSISQPPAPQQDSTESDAPKPIGAERVLPPPSMKVPPHPATRAQLYQPNPPAGEGQSQVPASNPVPEQSPNQAPSQGQSANQAARPGQSPLPSRGQHPAPRPIASQDSSPETEPVAAQEPVEGDATEHHPTHHSVDDAPQGGRSSNIEQWMSDLRSARRRPEKTDDEGKHRGGEGRTVSVNELLRRQNHD